MADYGIKIAQPGKSVSSIDRADYVFWSKYHTRTILISGSTTIFCPNNATTTLTITHNLGYVPQVALFTVTQTNSRSVKIPFEFWDTSTGYLEEALIVSLFTDRIEIPFSRFSIGSSFTYTVKYLIFMEKIL